VKLLLEKEGACNALNKTTEDVNALEAAAKAEFEKMDAKANCIIIPGMGSRTFRVAIKMLQKIYC
jgi:hypothetical protein